MEMFRVLFKHLLFIPGLAHESGGCNQISRALCELHFNKAINIKM